MKPLMFLLLLMITGRLFAQTDTSSIAVFKDARVDWLIKKQIEINEVTTRNARRSAPGYRILVINTNDRNKAYAAKTKIYQEFPELKAYLMYQSPFYKIKVGNFKDRADAEAYQSSIKQFFPTGVYIIRDVIEVNPDKSADLE